MASGSRLRWLCVMWFATFSWTSVCLAQDTISLGVAGVAAGQIARLPVYVRDVSGTPVGMDQEGRIQSIHFRVLFTNAQLIEGCGTTQFTDCEVLFVPAGVLMDLTPSDQSLSIGSASMAVRRRYDPATSPIPFTLDKAAPGDLIGHIEAKIVKSAVLGSQINFGFDSDAESTSLSDFNGTATEVPGNGLLVSGGTITVSECTTAPTETNVTFTSSGGGTVGEPVHFQAAGFGYTFRECDTVTWNFAGQGTATGLTATHTFNSPGTFAVAMTVTNPSGSVIIVRQVSIAAPLCSPPPAASSLSMTVRTANGACGVGGSECPTLTPITFTAEAFQYNFQDCDSVTWSFSDGQAKTGESVTTSFTQTGNLNVTMTLSNPSGQVSIVRTIAIGNGGSPSCSAAPPADKIAIGWSGGCSSPTTSCPKDVAITFTPLTFGYTFLSCDRFEWSFGDGSALSTLKSPTHTYTASGSFTVALRVFNTNGSVTFFQNLSTSAAQLPACDCVASAPGTWPVLRFADFHVAVSNCEPIRYQWNFGDGTSQTAFAPLVGHLYTKPGTYHWSVQVISQNPSCLEHGIIVIPADTKRRAVRK